MLRTAIEIKLQPRGDLLGSERELRDGVECENEIILFFF